MGLKLFDIHSNMERVSEMERQTKINFMRELSSLTTHALLKKGARVKLLKPAKSQKMEMKNKQGTRD